MAAPCREMLKTVALRGLCQMTSRVPCMHRYAALEAFSLGSYQKFPPNRQVHCSHGAKLMSAQTEPHKTTEESEEQPEYIPKRKAKNPMMKIGFAW
ncbi:hypothetical protein JZ751_019996 [Albula glossodonta]|uniref:Uncharacterized protein n=1 Tax=Albula glossodonta TaxID=121402 RepID=A0A8T2NK92_9TELE|nr:hypothetical protein JZ751_019996 [Albula glossodonta]